MVGGITVEQRKTGVCVCVCVCVCVLCHTCVYMYMYMHVCTSEVIQKVAE